MGMSDPRKRAERRAKQAQEVEESQAKLRASIAETERLMDASDEMLRRHRRELDADDPDDK